MYIKVKIQDIIDGIIPKTVGADLARILRKHGLKIYSTDDLGEKLEYHDIGEYRYLLVKAFDITTHIRGMISKGREKPPTQAEMDDIQQYIFLNGYETVEELPLQGII